MTKRRKGVLALMLLVASLLIIVSYFMLPHFWIVAAVPGVSLLMFQFAALSSWRWRQQLFIATDWFYYLVIAGLRCPRISLPSECRSRVSLFERLREERAPVPTGER